MSGKVQTLIAGVALVLAAGPGTAQTTNDSQEPVRSQIVRRQNQFRAMDQLRYQIGLMERVLETAVEHGASVWRDRIQAIAPVQAMLLENARVRGYRLDNYGVFFDVDVPSGLLETTLFTALQTLDQNGLGLQNAVNILKTYLQNQAANDATVQQAFKRIELQLPALPPPAESPNARAAAAGGAAASGDAAAAADPILNNPAEVFRAEVMQAVVDAMLDYSGPLGVSPDEWLAVGVRRNEMRPRIGLENAQTVIARVRGDDLTAFHAGQISRDDVIKRVEVRVQ